MKLFEILDKSIKGLRTSNKEVQDTIRNTNQRVIGIGAQAIAYLHQKFPNQIIKTIQISGTNDPQYQFLRLCLKHQNNPYFPKIFAVKQYKTKDVSRKERSDKFSELQGEYGEPFDDIPNEAQKYTLFVVMEKLQPFSHMGIFRQLGVNPTPDDMTPRDKQSLRLTSGLNRTDIMIRMAMSNPIFRKKVIMTTPDPKFAQALRLLEPLFKHYSPDLHTGNIMIRGSNQLVFIDPITIEGSS